MDSGVRPRNPVEFRAKAVSLIRAGQTVDNSSSDLDVSCAILHRWVKRDKIDRGKIPGVLLAESRECEHGSYEKHENVFEIWKTRSKFFVKHTT